MAAHFLHLKCATASSAANAAAAIAPTHVVRHRVGDDHFVYTRLFEKLGRVAGQEAVRRDGVDFVGAALLKAVGGRRPRRRLVDYVVHNDRDPTADIADDSQRRLFLGCLQEAVDGRRASPRRRWLTSSG